MLAWLVLFGVVGVVGAGAGDGVAGGAVVVVRVVVGLVRGRIDVVGVGVGGDGGGGGAGGVGGVAGGVNCW